MQAVVTGGAGFIGSNLVDALLARGDEVTVVDNFASGKREHLNPAATLLEHDIREPFSVDADVVFHLAAQADVQTSMKDPGYDAAVNVVGTANVLAGGRRGAQVIFSSSGGAGYGECPGAGDRGVAVRAAVAVRDREEVRRGVPRRLEPDPRHEPCVAALRERLRASGRTRGSKAASSRSSSSAWRAGEETVIFGDGEQQRDFVYVGDIVAALLATVGRERRPVQHRHRRLRRASTSCMPRAAAPLGSARSPRTARRGSATSSAR